MHGIDWVDLDADGKPVKWKVENLGETRSDKKVTLSLPMPGWMNILIKSLSVKTSLQLKN